MGNRKLPPPAQTRRRIRSVIVKPPRNHNHQAAKGSPMMYRNSPLVVVRGNDNLDSVGKIPHRDVKYDQQRQAWVIQVPDSPPRAGANYGRPTLQQKNSADYWTPLQPSYPSTSKKTPSPASTITSGNLESVPDKRQTRKTPLQVLWEEAEQAEVTSSDSEAGHEPLVNMEPHESAGPPTHPDPGPGKKKRNRGRLSRHMRRRNSHRKMIAKKEELEATNTKLEKELREVKQQQGQDPPSHNNSRRVEVFPSDVLTSHAPFFPWSATTSPPPTQGPLVFPRYSGGSEDTSEPPGGSGQNCELDNVSSGEEFNNCPSPEEQRVLLYTPKGTLEEFDLLDEA